MQSSFKRRSQTRSRFRGGNQWVPNSVGSFLPELETEQLRQYKPCFNGPARAVMIAWKKLKRHLRALYRDARLANSKIGSPIAGLIKQLFEVDLIDARYAGVMTGFGELKNIATYAKNHQSQLWRHKFMQVFVYLLVKVYVRNWAK